MPKFERNMLELARSAADANWREWRDDFEFIGDCALMPTLADRYRFCCFCRDYNLMRNMKSRTIEAVRQALHDSDDFRHVVSDTTGRALDALARQIPHINTKEISLLSKLAAFARPDVFVAWDRYARRGAHYLARPDKYPPAPQGQPLRSPKTSAPYGQYEKYVADVRALYQGEVGNEVRDFVGGDEGRGNAFILRVLDHCLMIVGGRRLRIE